MTCTNIYLGSLGMLRTADDLQDAQTYFIDIDKDYRFKVAS